MRSNFISIRDAPGNWTVGLVRGMFSQYGPIEDITIEATSNSLARFIIEFESEEDAEAALEDNKGTDYKISLYKPEEISSGSTSFVITNASPSDKVLPNVRMMDCSNSNCCNHIVIETRVGSIDTFLDEKSQRMYCSTECFNLEKDMKGRVDIYDKWLASLGRSGTGMLKNSSKLNKLLITIDSDGARRVDVHTSDTL